MGKPFIRTSGRTFYGKCDFNDRFIFKEAGWAWNSPSCSWITSDPKRAKRLIQYFSEEAKTSLIELESEHAKMINASRATDANVHLPAPAGLAYMPFQKASIALAAGKKDVLFADEMGLGKTVQALGMINVLHDTKSVLIVCPASLKTNWMRECEKWLVNKDLKPCIVKNGKDFAPRDAKLVIINYDLLAKHRESIRARSWDVLICDESHNLKNSKTARTVEIVGNKDLPPLQAGRKLFLTGTPILNRPSELWTTLRYFGVERDWTRFHKDYCGGKKTRFGWDVSGATNLKELEERLRGSVMIRRLKSEVLTDLPPKIRNVVPLEVSAKVQKLIAKQNEICEPLLQGFGLEEASSQLKTKEVDFTELSRIRHDLGVEKVPIAIDFAVNELDSIESMLIFAHHRDVIDGIATGLREKKISVRTLTGEDNTTERQKVVDDFQAGKFRVLVAAIEAAGVGLTLTRTSRVIFAESSWTPAKLQQAEDRAHRIGQNGSVFVSHLVFDNSLDAKILSVVVQKSEIAERALDGSAVAATEIPVISEIQSIKPDTQPDIPRDETRYEKRLREAESIPDGICMLESGETFTIERTTFNGKRYLFVGNYDAESQTGTRIKDQEEQDEIFAKIVADRDSRNRFASVKEELSRVSIPDGFYATTEGEKLKFFSVKENRVDGYIGGKGPVSISLIDQRNAARAITDDPKGAAERFASELGCCFACARPLTNDESRHEGIGPDCREKHEWFPVPPPSIKPLTAL